VFLGLNGVVVKSHGSANAAGVANAVHVAARLLEEDITQRITSDLARIDGLGKMELADPDDAVRFCSVRAPRCRAKSVSNAELAERVDTSDEWIVERTGIANRYIAGEGETTSTLARRRRARRWRLREWTRRRSTSSSSPRRRPTRPFRQARPRFRPHSASTIASRSMSRRCARAFSMR
jgi:hypothetical protein